MLTAEELASPEHRSRHPLGRVPVLEDHEGSLFESAALCLQVADEHPESLLIGALGTRERGLVYQWTLFAMAELEPPLITVISASDPAVANAAAARERFEVAVGVIEAALDGHDYLVADRFSVADIVVGGVLTSARRRDVLPPAVRVSAYLERLAARPAYCRAYPPH
jgi:glutathione S-transferase